MFFQIFCALVTSMAIVYSEDLDLWPHVIGQLWHLCNRLNDIQNNCNSIFICFSNQAYVRISGKRSNNTEFLTRSFRILEKRQLRICSNSLHTHRLIELQFFRFFTLFRCILTILRRNATVSNSSLTLKTVSPRNCIRMTVSLILKALCMM
jgi:intracellular sulfur oxidation DsrE/DsrF family protein